MIVDDQKSGRDLLTSIVISIVSHTVCAPIPILISYWNEIITKTTLLLSPSFFFQSIFFSYFYVSFIDIFIWTKGSRLTLLVCRLTLSNYSTSILRIPCSNPVKGQNITFVDPTIGGNRLPCRIVPYLYLLSRISSKILRYASYFELSSRCLEIGWNTVSCVWVA